MVADEIPGGELGSLSLINSFIQYGFEIIFYESPYHDKLKSFIREFILTEKISNKIQV